MTFLDWFERAPVIVLGVLAVLALRFWILREDALAARVELASGRTGREAAEMILRAGGMPNVPVQPASGELSDHYDPARHVARLSRAACDGRSAADAALAALVAGQALQFQSQSGHGTGNSRGKRDVPILPSGTGGPRWHGRPVAQAARLWFPRKIGTRTGRFVLLLHAGLAEWACLISQAAWMVFLAGATIGIRRLVDWSIDVFGIHLLIQILNVPLDWNAFLRGRERLLAVGAIDLDEAAIATRAGRAAAWAGVASAVAGPIGPWLSRHRGAVRRFLGRRLRDGRGGSQRLFR